MAPSTRFLVDRLGLLLLSEPDDDHGDLGRGGGARRLGDDLAGASVVEVVVEPDHRGGGTVPLLDHRAAGPEHGARHPRLAGVRIRPRRAARSGHRRR
jgi:hypothetical protein